jgi:hypothetical protein
MPARAAAEPAVGRLTRVTGGPYGLMASNGLRQALQ